MADLPNLTPQQIQDLVPEASDIEPAGAGGQKQVFKATIEGVTYALKFANAPQLPELETEELPMTDIAVRVQREVDTMRECRSRHMVKLGPIGLTFRTIHGQRVLFFSEEFVAGRDLHRILREDGPFPAFEVARMGLHIADAIKGLWQLQKIHRDIKPSNIMRRDADGEYLLLDAGLVFDVLGESVSIGPVGTPPYFSPEQFDFTNRRTVLDFRSDQFSLGVTMYQLATGTHPFWSSGDTSRSLFNKITTHNPDSLSLVVPGFPEELDRVILRMLGKSPHLRYRRCDELIRNLQAL